MIVKAGEEVTVSVPLAIAGVADDATWWLEDELGAVVVEETAASSVSYAPGVQNLTIDGSFNTLAAGSLTGYRLVRVRFRSLADFEGSRGVELGYGIVASQELEVQVNSFMVYNEAMALAASLSGLTGFLAADRSARITALADAWWTLVGLRYRLPCSDRQDRIIDFPGQESGRLVDYSAAELAQLDARFLACLKRAQLVEAEARLTTPADRLRREGITFSKIGETSQSFRPGMPLDLAISRRTLGELRGYVMVAPRFGRTG